MANKVDGHVTVKECRDLRHAQSEAFNVAFMRIADDVSEIAKAVNEIKIDSARREQKLEAVDIKISNHMEVEENAYNRFYTILGSAVAAIVAALSFLFFQGQELKEKIIKIDTTLEYGYEVKKPIN